MNILLISTSSVTSTLIHRILTEDNIITVSDDNNIPSSVDLILIDDYLMTDNFINSSKPGIVITQNATADLINRISGRNKTYVIKPFNSEQLKSRISQII